METKETAKKELEDAGVSQGRILRDRAVLQKRRLEAQERAAYEFSYGLQNKRRRKQVRRRKRSGEKGKVKKADSSTQLRTPSLKMDQQAFCAELGVVELSRGSGKHHDNVFKGKKALITQTSKEEGELLDQVSKVTENITYQMSEEVTDQNTKVTENLTYQMSEEVTDQNTKVTENLADQKPKEELTNQVSSVEATLTDQYAKGEETITDQMPKVEKTLNGEPSEVEKTVIDQGSGKLNVTDQDSEELKVIDQDSEELKCSNQNTKEQSFTDVKPTPEQKPWTPSLTPKTLKSSLYFPFSTFHPAATSQVKIHPLLDVLHQQVEERPRNPDEKM